MPLMRLNDHSIFLRHNCDNEKISSLSDLKNRSEKRFGCGRIMGFGRPTVFQMNEKAARHEQARRFFS